MYQYQEISLEACGCNYPFFFFFCSSRHKPTSIPQDKELKLTCLGFLLIYILADSIDTPCIYLIFFGSVARPYTKCRCIMFYNNDKVLDLYDFNDNSLCVPSYKLLFVDYFFFFNVYVLNYFYNNSKPFFVIFYLVLFHFCYISANILRLLANSNSSFHWAAYSGFKTAMFS